LKSRETPFRTNKKEAYTFEEDFEVFGQDGNLIKKEKTLRPGQGVKHENPWKNPNLPRHGYNKTINQTEYTEDPGKERPRPKTAGAWRHPTRYQSKPQPTVYHHFKNVNQHERMTNFFMYKVN